MWHNTNKPVEIQVPNVGGRGVGDVAQTSSDRVPEPSGEEGRKSGVCGKVAAPNGSRPFLIAIVIGTYAMSNVPNLDTNFNHILSHLYPKVFFSGL